MMVPPLNRTPPIVVGFPLSSSASVGVAALTRRLESGRSQRPQRAIFLPLAVAAPDLADQFEELTWLDTQSFCDLAEDRDAHRNIRPLNGSDITATDPCLFGEFFLRQSPFVPETAQICSQDILEIHSRHKRRIGTIDPGMIVPIRNLA